MSQRPAGIALVALLLTGCPGDVGPGDPVNAVCGDGVQEGAEVCDDGNAWGGDGCTELCTAEAGTLEAEPNNTPDEATQGSDLVHGSLWVADRDCFSIAVPEAGAVRAALLPADGEVCDAPLVLELLDPDGIRATSGLPPVNGCTSIEPDTDTWARYLSAGDYTLCVESPYGAEVPSYALQVDLLDSCTELAELAPDPRQDLEGDGIADQCDPDDDNDGVDDVSDNCPEAPNGPDQPIPWDTSDQGFVNLWIVLGGFSATSPESCQPSPESWTGPDDADAAPALGDSSEGTAWFAHHHVPGNSAVVNFGSWFSVEAPREAYAFTWVHSDGAQDVELAMGSDDGHRVWMNGVEVGLDSGCHGTGTDNFRYPVSLEDGWNRLLIKVFDGGGAWGLIARFYELDGETPITDLGLSIGGAAPWLDDQGDADGDGLGDFCDPEP